MKKLLQLYGFGAIVTVSALVYADAGVIIESRGDVRLKKDNGLIEKATVGKKYPDGSMVITGANGSAVVITEFGQMYRVGPSTTVKIGDKTGDTGQVPVGQGLMMALREGLGGPKGGPRAHGAVKGLGGNTADSKMSRRNMDRDLKDADSVPVESTEAKDLLKGHIYYRYGEYRKVIELLQPHFEGNRRSHLVKDLLASAYEAVGDTAKAQSVRSTKLR